MHKPEMHYTQYQGIHQIRKGRRAREMCGAGGYNTCAIQHCTQYQGTYLYIKCISDGKRREGERRVHVCGTLGYDTMAMLCIAHSIGVLEMNITQGEVGVRAS